MLQTATRDRDRAYSHSKHLMAVAEKAQKDDSTVEVRWNGTGKATGTVIATFPEEGRFVVQTKEGRQHTIQTRGSKIEYNISVIN